MALLTTQQLLATEYYPPTAGLVGWWRGEGNAKDSARGHDGSMEGMGYTQGVFGQAFASGSGRIVIPDSSDFELSSFTIGAWINVEADSWAVFCRMNTAFVPYGMGGSMNGTIGVGINNRNGVVEESLYAPITYHQWHQVTGTFDDISGQLSLYIDGQLAAHKSTAAKPILKLEHGALGIGNNTIFGFPMIGEIDEVVLYSRALTPSEVFGLWEPKCLPHRATATARLDNGFVVDASITDSGCGYSNAPQVTILGGGGTGAAAIAVVENGKIVQLKITDAGIGYTNQPSITIDAPVCAPWLEIVVSKVVVTQHLVKGRTYIVESSTDMRSWAQIGLPFTALEDLVQQEFDVRQTGQFFRVREQP